MYLQFTLSMPNVGSWNGKWSGRENLYALVHSFSTQKAKAKAAELLAKRSFYYNFGDGWGASVGVTEITSTEARRVRKASKGFCGYNWMVDSILADGTIYGPTRPKPEPVQTMTLKASPTRDELMAGLVHQMQQSILPDAEMRAHGYSEKAIRNS